MKLKDALIAVFAVFFITVGFFRVILALNLPAVPAGVLRFAVGWGIVVLLDRH